MNFTFKTMITLPEYIIEKVGSVWTLYQTEDCITLEFSTRDEAEIKLKSLKL